MEQIHTENPDKSYRTGCQSTAHCKELDEPSVLCSYAQREEAYRCEEFKWYESTAMHKVYLSAILDLCDRGIIAYIIRGRNDNPLVFDTLDAAIKDNPDAHPPYFTATEVFSI